MSMLIISTMVSVLVTGASRGIGLYLVKYFLNHEDPPKIVIAACRNPDGATELQELKKIHDNLHLLQLGKIILPFFKRSIKVLISLCYFQMLRNVKHFRKSLRRWKQ